MNSTCSMKISPGHWSVCCKWSLSKGRVNQNTTIEVYAKPIIEVGVLYCPNSDSIVKTSQSLYDIVHTQFKTHL